MAKLVPTYLIYVAVLCSRKAELDKWLQNPFT